MYVYMYSTYTLTVPGRVWEFSLNLDCPVIKKLLKTLRVWKNESLTKVDVLLLPLRFQSGQGSLEPFFSPLNCAPDASYPDPVADQSQGMKSTLELTNLSSLDVFEYYSLSHTLHVWYIYIYLYIYLHNWVIFRANVGKYSMHEAIWSRWIQDQNKF